MRSVGRGSTTIAQEGEAMDELTGKPPGGERLTPERVAAGAIQQAARHERALRACLAELRGIDEPSGELAASIRRRSSRHAERAIGRTRTAIRLNRDPLAEAFLAALLERHERNALCAQEPATERTGPSLATAG
jgi:hypothetical protein